MRVNTQRRPSQSASLSTPGIELVIRYVIRAQNPIKSPPPVATLAPQARIVRGFLAGKLSEERMTMGLGVNPVVLKETRKRLGLTQEQLAVELSVSRVSIIRWEAGTRRIPRMVGLALKQIELEIQAENETFHSSNKN
jgi:DNA-binding XRE family transcriptional regulator